MARFENPVASATPVDVAVKELRLSEIESGWINAGGDIRIFGDINIPVHRREIDGSVRLLGEFSETAIATSIIRVDESDRFPGRITGTRDQALSPGIWTVIAPSAWLADALTKVAATAPLCEALDIIKKCGGLFLQIKD